MTIPLRTWLYSIEATKPSVYNSGAQAAPIEIAKKVKLAKAAEVEKRTWNSLGRRPGLRLR
jgi:hypothetical protein